MNNLINIKKIKGDASFRKFFRKKNKNFNSIIVFAKKEKFKNLLVYDAINKILNKNKILAPNLYNENYNKNYFVWNGNFKFRVLLLYRYLTINYNHNLASFYLQRKILKTFENIK